MQIYTTAADPDWEGWSIIRQYLVEITFAPLIPSSYILPTVFSAYRSVAVPRKQGRVDCGTAASI